MNASKYIGLALLGLLLALPAWAQTKYGDANIEAGQITVLRQGKRLVYQQGRPVQINHEDVIRVGSDSRVVLATVEKATLTLGSNAVFHVKPWEKKSKKGLFRMLFGKFRASITGLTGGERFNVSTATATIGVKGTQYGGAVNVYGDAWVLALENVVQVAGQDGVDQDVIENFISVVVGSNPSTVPIPPPPNLAGTIENVDSPAPNSDDAVNLPFVEALIEAGLITEEQAAEAIQEAGNFGELLDEITKAVQNSANESGVFAPIDVQFEK